MIELAFDVLWYGMFVVAAVLGWAAVRLLAREQRTADPRKIHALEYELGMRDDPPRTGPFDSSYPQPITDAPGQVVPYRRIHSGPQSIGNMAAAIKDTWTQDRAMTEAYKKAKAQVDFVTALAEEDHTDGRHRTQEPQAQAPAVGTDGMARSVDAP